MKPSLREVQTHSIISSMPHKETGGYLLLCLLKLKPPRFNVKNVLFIISFDIITHDTSRHCELHDTKCWLLVLVSYITPLNLRLESSKP